MKYFVYPLSFETPVHFGTADNGGNLESVDMVLSSDTMFSAICHEAGNADVIEQFVEALQHHTFLLSSAFPYVWEKEGYSLYLPKPLYGVMKDRPSRNLTETKREAIRQKKQKKEKFIRAMYLSSEDTGRYVSSDSNREDVSAFAESFTQTHVNLRGDGSEPYNVGAYTFAPNAGLFIIVGFENLELKSTWDALLTSLGLTGIGGERSSGYGKFITRDTLCVKADSNEQDIRALSRLISNDTATWKLTISATAPAKEEVVHLQDGYYKLKKRSGFIASPGHEGIKRNTYYVLMEGSCVPHAIHGRVITFRTPAIGHAIYRNGAGFCIGVVYDE